MKYASLLLTAGLLLAPLPALAEPYTYGPDPCEFKMTFPEKPLIEQKCTDGEKKACAEIVTYTKIVTAEASVNFRITCTAADPKELERYTPEIMVETVKQMLTEANLEGDPPKATTQNGYKVAATVGTGVRGDRDVIYTAQLWIGEKSIFSLEADMSGPQDDKTDKLFTQVLGSMQSKTRPPKPAAEKTKQPAEKPAP